MGATRQEAIGIGGPDCRVLPRALLVSSFYSYRIGHEMLHVLSSLSLKL